MARLLAASYHDLTSRAPTPCSYAVVLASRQRRAALTSPREVRREQQPTLTVGLTNGAGPYRRAA
jgi:hypothetical protein